MKEQNFFVKYFSSSWKGWLITAAFFFLAILASLAITQISDAFNNQIMIFLLAVLLISYFTDGYLYGIVASVLSVVFINFYFLFPFQSFTLSIEGYPLSFFAMLLVSVLTSTLTTKAKAQTRLAQKREQNTRELHEQYVQLEESKQRVALEAEREKMRGNLLRAVSHDLRTPLTSILGASSTLSETWDTLPPERRRQLLTYIQNDSEWLLRMVENLLSVTRIHSDAAQLKKQPEAVEEIVAEAVTKVQKHFDNCRIDVRVPEEFLMVPMDALLIEQVLINLLENSLTHANSDQPTKLQVSVRDGLAIFEVLDRGRGIDPEQLPQLFDGGVLRDMGAKGDKGRGMGIGLSVCMSIIKAHNGTMEADNRPGGGAVFRFSLPLE